MWSRPSLRAALLCSALFSLPLAGCGWHLRGTIGAEMPPELARVQLTGTSLESALGGAVDQGLEQLGSTVVPSTGEASAVLQVGEKVQRRALSLARNGTVDEYELHYALSYTVRDPGGTVLLGPETVDLYRSYTYDPAQVLAKGNEEAQLREEMMNAAVAQMLRRVALGLAH